MIDVVQDVAVKLVGVMPSRMVVVEALGEIRNGALVDAVLEAFAEAHAEAAGAVEQLVESTALGQAIGVEDLRGDACDLVGGCVECELHVRVVVRERRRTRQARPIASYSQQMPVHPALRSLPAPLERPSCRLSGSPRRVGTIRREDQ